MAARFARNKLFLVCLSSFKTLIEKIQTSQFGKNGFEHKQTNKKNTKGNVFLRSDYTLELLGCYKRFTALLAVISTKRAPLKKLRQTTGLQLPAGRVFEVVRFGSTITMPFARSDPTEKARRIRLERAPVTRRDARCDARTCFILGSDVNSLTASHGHYQQLDNLFRQSGLVQRRALFNLMTFTE